MNDKMRAKDLLERVENGERSRELVEDLDDLADTENDEAHENVILGIYKILADEPHLFVESPESLFEDLHSSDEATLRGARITFTWVAENPPDKFRNYIDPEILKLLSHSDNLIRGSACGILAHFAQTDAESVEAATVGLRSLLTDESPQIRGQACIALGHLEDETSLQRIKKLQLDNSQYTRNLAKWATEKIESRRVNESTEDTVHWQRADLFEYDPNEFERLIADLWSEMGYSTRVTQQSNDGGYDVDAKNDDEQVLIQAKRHQNPIDIKTVRATAGLLEIENPDRVAVVTSSRFTNAAEETDRLELIAGDQLCDLLAANRIQLEYNNK